MTNPYDIAAWRFEQIAPLVDHSLNRAQLRALMRMRTSDAIEWPQSKRRKERGDPPVVKPIPKSTLSRWLHAWRKNGYEGLLPAPRQQRISAKAEKLDRWILYAIGLAYEQPQRSLTQIEVYLKLEFDDYDISRATLARHLFAHPAYAGVKALRTGKTRKRRDLYEASAAHECWQLDGKGPFSVRLVDGTRIEVHVLSILDDYSRAILGIEVAFGEDTAAAISVFKEAVEKYGLPGRFQHDRGSGFESHAFRGGIARLGVHRNAVKPRHPEAQGKIEAYHRSLTLWFVVELRAQQVVDREHLSQLCKAMIHVLYNRHFHRSIGCSPATRLGEVISKRTVSRDQLARAFMVDTSATSHPKTGEVRLPNGVFRVPIAYAGKRRDFRYDPYSAAVAVLVIDTSKERDLELFTKKPLPTLGTKDVPKRGVGELQKLVDIWQGQERPNAQPGFGLPEVFGQLTELTCRQVPASEREGHAVLAFYRKFGPLACAPFVDACHRAQTALGGDRPLAAYLDFLERQIVADRKRAESSESANTADVEVQS